MTFNPTAVQLQSRAQLFESMCERTPIRYTYNGVPMEGIVTNIQAEDGSGYKFIVTLSKQQFFISFKKG